MPRRAPVRRGRLLRDGQPGKAGGLLVDYCRRAGIDAVIRGVRSGRDLEHELPMAHMNRELAGIETFFLAAEPDQTHLSSTLVTALDRESLAAKRM